MKRMKTFLLYGILLIVFFIFSEFIINVGINSSYKDISCSSSISQVEITKAQATLVNGRMSGKINASTQDGNQLLGKYVKFEFYSDKGLVLGKKYIEINQLTQDFNFYYELQHVASYGMSIVDEKEEGELNILPKEMSKAEVVWLTIITLMICS